jgi:choline dehydrogenase-like flavoprotein
MIHQPNGSPGPLAVCGLETDGTLGRIWEPAPHVGWSSWERFGFRAVSPPVLVRNADERLELFAAGANGRLGHCWQLLPGEMTEWSEWEDLGPPIQFEPTVFPNRDGRLEVFATGPQGRLGHMWQLASGRASGWSEWNLFGCELRSAPVAARTTHGALEVFGIGADGLLGHVWQSHRQDGSTDWSEWNSFGFGIQSAPVLCQLQSGALELFGIGTDGCLGHIWQDLELGGGVSWSAWDSFAIPLQTPPVVCPTKQGGLEVFAIGTDGCLGHIWQHVHPGGRKVWSHWDSFGVGIRGRPAVAQGADGELVVLAVGAHGELGSIRQWQSDGQVGWGGWHSIGPGLSPGRLAVCSWMPARVAEHAQAFAAAPLRAPQEPPKPRTARPDRLSADFCVIGAGPAGITLSEGLLAAGASVVLVESGDWHENPDAQTLNHGDAEGPIIKGSLKYLRNGRRRQVQGAATVWGGWCMPFGPIDFERRDWVQLSGWPVAADELGPFQLRAADTLGIDPFDPGAEDGPLVRLSYHYPRDLLVFRNKLMALAHHPALFLELGSTAVALERRGDRIESVRIARLAGGEARVTAPTVVLAAGGIENARILLHNAVASENAMVGRCFMEHPHVLAGSVQLPEPEALRACLYRSEKLEVLSLTESAQRADRLLNATVQLMPASVPDTPGGMVKCDLFVRSEQAPNPDSRLVLGQRPDRFGWPQPELNWRLLEQDWNTVVRTAELVGRILEKRYGASSEVSIRPEKPWPAPPGDPGETKHPTWGNHHIGTTRMSSDPAEGVVDSDCRVHDVANLYVAGSSVFPTGGAANPTFTIVAMAHRLADHLTGSGQASIGQQELGGQAPEFRPAAS